MGWSHLPAWRQPDGSAPQRVDAPPAPPQPYTLEQLGAPAFAVVVYGTPAPQGSKDYKGEKWITRKDGTRKQVPNLVESSDAAVQAWRNAVISACRLVLPRGWTPLDEPLIVDMTFTMDRKVNEWEWLHSAQPDVDKLARATNDALKLGKVIRDDSLIAAHRLGPNKVFARSAAPDALTASGAVVRLWREPAELKDQRRQHALLMRRAARKERVR